MGRKVVRNTESKAGRRRKPRRMTPELLSELIAVHAQCVLDQQGRCPLTVFSRQLCWEINRAMGLANNEDRGFRRVDEMCAAKPLGAERFDPHPYGEDRLLDIVYDILQVNLAYLKDGHLEHEDHEAYFQQHVAILKDLSGITALRGSHQSGDDELGRASRDGAIEPGGIASSPDGKLWRVLKVDDERILLAKLRGKKRVEVGWEEWAKGWELKFP